MAKGGENERAKCREWSLWFSNDEKDDLFWRSPGSGGRSKVRSKSSKTTDNAYGDLSSTSPIGEPLLRVVTIEVKKGYNRNLDLLSLIDSKSDKQELQKFWRQVSTDAQNAQKAEWGSEPVLVVHRDRHLPIVFMRIEFFNLLAEYCGPANCNKIYCTIDNDKLVLIRQMDFFIWCVPGVFDIILGKRNIKKNWRVK